MARTRRPTSSTRNRVAGSATISESTVIGVDDPKIKTLETPPLLLMPMRLEYRVVHKESGVKFLDRTPDNLAFEKARPTKNADSQRSIRQSEAARRKARSAIMTQPFEVKSLDLNGKTEIWFRWYPDDAFSEKSIQAITEDEATLLATYRASLGALAWWNTEDARAVELWQAFAGAVGPYRALHLIRTGGAGTPTDDENRMGRIAALPVRVKLFAVTGENVSILGQGKVIPHNGQTPSEVNYSPQAIDIGGWLTDFSKALDLGMGARITEEKVVEDALNADWIIAVGIYTKDARTEIETLLKDRIATGEFEILPQDAPTNNSPGEQSILTNPRNDLTEFLRVAAQDENGAIDAAVGDYGAGLLAEILGIDQQPLRKAVRAADGAFQDARAMLRVIGPALLDDAPNDISVLEGVSENDFVEVMAASIAARGTLPPIRSGRNAYGIATMAEIIEDPPGPEPALKRDRVHRLLRVFCGIWRQYAPSHADGVVPRIEPDDSEAAEKVEEILKTNRVSTRIDVAKGGSGNTKPIGCPYVSGKKPEHKPQAYLERLRHTGLDNLPDPTSDDLDWPLLYRLARMSLTVNSTLQVARSVLGPRSKSLGYLEHITASDKQQLKPATDKLGSYSSRMLSELKLGELTLVGVETIELIRVINANFSDSLLRLQSIAQRENGRAQLGMLMREVFDLFQHRIDAWATGLAFERIRNNRRAGQTGLNAGYYGFLGKLRQESATGSGDGFLLAPSPMQATAAAVLRSSYLRHRGNGAFKIDLRSARVRNGLSILDLLMKGHSLNEALGLRGERWLHDHKLSRLTLALRGQFPISNLSPPEKEKPKPSGQRVFDGLAFLAGKVKGADELHLQKLKTFIDDDLDSFSDIVVAEAVYQRSMGAGEVANAWLQVLSGEPVPGTPQFLRTHRQGQASTYRVTYLLEEEPIPPDPAPRVIAEPALARFCRDILATFSQAAINVRVSIVGVAPNVFTIALGLGRDLSMDPIDLVVGGESELLLRSRYELTQRWLTDPAIVERLGQLNGTGMEAFLASKFEIEFDLGAGENSVKSLLETATILRKSVQNSRPLEPSDLNAAASPEHILDEATEIRIIQAAIGKLRDRAEAMQRRVALDKESFGAARRDFVKRVDEYLDAKRRGLEQRVIDRLITETRVRRQTLAAELRVVSKWAEPSALRSFTLEEVFADVSSLDARLEQLERRLEKRVHGLSQTIAGTTASNYSTLSDARLARDQLLESIKKALDGDALPILPPYVIEAATKAEVQALQNIGGSLGAWATVRSRVSDALQLAMRDKSAKFFGVTSAATQDDSETADPRSEAVAPRSYHQAVFVARRTPAKIGRTVVGIVLDEWSQQRPSAKQTAGIAINYDSPQAQSPHCLLLCAPREGETSTWIHATAARIVWEAIQWMKIRALSTSDRPTPAALLPYSNQIAFKKTGSRTVSRIPEQPDKLSVQPWFAEGRFELHTGTGKRSDFAREASRFHKVKE